jgi:hypothetical protein
VTLATVACGSKERSSDEAAPPESAHRVAEVARVLERHGFRLRPSPRSVCFRPEAVRQQQPMTAVVGCVFAAMNALERSPVERYAVQAIVFRSEEEADRAFSIEPEWMKPSSESLHTAQFQLDNVIATIGTGPTDERVADLRAALDELASG